MKRPLYYLLCAIACTSMVGATLPMAAIAEAIQPQATAEQQAQSDAPNSDTGKAEDGTDTIATADTAEDSTATSPGISATNTESATGPAAATTTPTVLVRKHILDLLKRLHQERKMTCFFSIAMRSRVRYDGSSCLRLRRCR